MWAGDSLSRPCGPSSSPTPATACACASATAARDPRASGELGPPERLAEGGEVAVVAAGDGEPLVIAFARIRAVWRHRAVTVAQARPLAVGHRIPHDVL